MKHKRDEPEGTPQKERTRQEEVAWERASMIRIAKSWCAGIDMLERQNRLTTARSSIIDACQTLALMSPEDHWLAKRALTRLDELGIGPALEFSKSWRARLEGAPETMGVAIVTDTDLDFGAPDRWAEENT